MASTIDIAEVRVLYHALIRAWNRRDATDFANQFAIDGNLVGFDGSVENGSADIYTHLRDIFARHQTPPYVTKVKEVRMLGNDTAIVRAIAGMAPPGLAGIDPALHTIQTLVAVKRNAVWRVALLQNTPAAFDGRPELEDAFTRELE